MSEGSSHESQKLPGLWRPVPVVAAVLAFVFAAAAFFISPPAEIYNRADALYLSAQVLGLHMPLPEMKESAPWLLFAARMLAVFVWAFAAVAVSAYLFGKDLRRRWTILRGRHTIVCGLQGTGLQLVLVARRSKQHVIAVDERTDTEEGRRAEARGAVVVKARLTGGRWFGRAGGKRASHLVAAAGQDAVNVAIALHAMENGGSRKHASRLKCHVHIADPHLRAFLRHHRVFRSTAGAPRAGIFNFFEDSARLLLLDHPLDWKPINADGDQSVQLILVGFSAMAEAVLVRAAMMAHYANEKKLRVTVIDSDAPSRRQTFLWRYPQFPNAVDPGSDFLQLNPDDPATSDQIANLCDQSEKHIPTVVISRDDDSKGVCTALALAERLHGKVPIRLHLSIDAGLGRLFEKGEIAATLSRQVTVFGAGGDARAHRWVDPELDTLARNLHREYVRRLPEPERTPDNRSTCRWDILDDDLVDSNRQQADHMSVKLRAIGCEICGNKSDRANLVHEFTGDEIELMAKLEHNRWMAERYLAGWQYAPGPKNLELRTSPHLVPWENVRADIREFDRSAVRIIPEVLKLVNKQIVRVRGAAPHDKIRVTDAGGH